MSQNPDYDTMIEFLSEQPCKSEMWKESAAEAIFWFASENYLGSHSNLYIAMCQTRFEPSMSMNEENRFDDNSEAGDFYLALNEKFGESVI
jgi:hypothetical protein